MIFGNGSDKGRESGDGSLIHSLGEPTVFAGGKESESENRPLIHSGAGDRKENVQHGTVFLPVDSYHCLVPDTYTELALHWHDEMEITLIREGESDYRVGQQTFRASEGSLIIVPPVTLHSACEIPGRTMISDSIVFHLDFLGMSDPDIAASRYLRPLAEGRMAAAVCLSEKDDGYEEIKGGFLEAWDTFSRKEPFYELHLKEVLFKVLHLLFLNGHIREQSGRRSDIKNSRQLQDILHYIENHYQEHISVADLAGVGGFSESHLMAFFRQEVGMTCVSYINHVRIQRAAHLLESGDEQVMEIALSCGFENVSYFNRLFQRQFGMTPGEFRRGR